MFLASHNNYTMQMSANQVKYIKKRESSKKINTSAVIARDYKML